MTYKPRIRCNSSSTFIKCFGKLWKESEIECQQCLMHLDCATRTAKGAIYIFEEEPLGRESPI